MTYQELLESEEWITKRTQIVQRDHNKCHACNNIKLVNDLNCAYLDLSILPKWGKRPGYTLPDFCLKLFLNTIPLPDSPYIIVYFNDQMDHPNIQLIRKMLSAEVDEYIDMKSFGRFIDEYFSKRYKQFMDEHQLNNVPISTREKINKELFQSSEYNNFTKEYPNQYRYIELNETEFKTMKYIFAKGLNVHHKYYQLGKLPWEYPNEALQTYCHFCHKELHSHTKIPKLDEIGNQIGLMTPCPRCGGAGEFPEYKHVERGLCFDCRGARYIEFK